MSDNGFGVPSPEAVNRQSIEWTLRAKYARVRMRARGTHALRARIMRGRIHLARALVYPPAPRRHRESIESSVVIIEALCMGNRGLSIGSVVGDPKSIIRHLGFDNGTLG